MDRPPTGRPAGSRPLTRELTISLTESTYDRLQRAAKTRDCSVDRLVREMIDVGLVERRS